MVLVQGFDIALLLPRRTLAVQPLSGAGKPEVEEDNHTFRAIWIQLVCAIH
jgi:hypothetical protein